MTPDDLTSSVKQALRVGSGAGPLYVIRYRQRCPSCDQYWTWDCVGRHEETDLAPDPIKQGMANLCGSCEALRRVNLVVQRSRYMSQPSQVYETWSDADERRAWARLRSYAKDYAAEIKSGALEVVEHDRKSATLEDGRKHEIRDDKRSVLERLFRGDDGIWRITLDEMEWRTLGMEVRIDWRYKEAPRLAKAARG